MAYIGSTPPSRFVSNRAASVYSGDGSTVAFTLEQVVTQDEDILVSVDGVIQEPSVAYAVSSGTTLTFDDPPSSNAGNNIFVYYLASQVGTVGHPSTQGLTATTGAFSSNATVAGTLGVTGVSTLTGAVNTGAGLTVANGLTLTDGNLVVASGHGIDFSANSNASGMSSELLHHYEEGTFTAQISTDSEYTGETQSGVYTKIGDIVFIQIRFQKSGTLNSGSNARFGLPFTSANNGVQSTGFRGSVENIDTSVVGVGGTIAANGAVLFLNEMTAAVTGHNLNGNDLGANFQIQIQGFYKAA